ncbi:NTE family protein [Sulfobacillus thermosulfidooxidans DSM 9293]|uniref:NTE family protein n=1 Tax=Sulfobacillus thermosulfidooxidans (strain DSM 9293 / VKM B-1269 / AT-1) TaxID=929705 RepID=A0A1W1WDB6_SULTA|nr:patatin-like phospholipase family protein [Sulfobacillus thermosulfidooxidans]SMC04276.1 NTE family protein [Sulfobacillus thermosulfidooxidans DSM 9293]
MRAVVFGGGGILGVAAIGILQALEEMHLRPDIIVGTSSGAIIGALYALGWNAQDLRDLALRVRRKDMIWNWRRMGRTLLTRHTLAESILDPEPFWSKLRQYVGHQTFADAKIPLYVVTTSLTHRTSVVFGSTIPPGFHELPHVFWVDGKEQEIFSVIRASSAIPGFFPPERIADMILVDGGMTDDFPLDVAQAAGATHALGLWIDEPVRWQVPSPSPHLLQVLNESVAATIHHMTLLKKNTVTIPYILIRLEMDHHADMARIPHIIRTGYEQTIARQHEILTEFGGHHP